MLDFREIEMKDKQRIDNALAQSDFKGCEYSFANNMAWRRLAGSKIAFFGDFYICCAFDTPDRIPRFIYPAGSGDIRSVIEEMKLTARSLGCPLVLSGVTADKLKLLEELYPDGFSAAYDRDSSDYIYLAEDLIGLKGKKFHAKRNHLARFRETNCVYSPLTENDIDECIVFLSDIYNENTDFSDHSYLAEQYAINTYFSYFFELGLCGGIIRQDGRIAAAAVGERLCSDTFCVHIEKADTSVPGIYAAINNLFAADAASDCVYINREEDLGIEGLRKAKLSYHPAFLLDKYTVKFK